MKTSIEIANRTKKRINSVYVKKIVRKTIKASGINLNSLEISIVFVSKAEIRKINRKYRKKDKSTDVLSFRYDLKYNVKDGKNIIGEVILCPEVIKKSAKENGISFQKEMAFVLSHGVLHLLGFWHGRKMYEVQDNLVSKILNLKS